MGFIKFYWKKTWGIHLWLIAMIAWGFSDTINLKYSSLWLYLTLSFYLAFEYWIYLDMMMLYAKQELKE